MNRSIKRRFITGACLTGIGIVLFGCAMAMCGWNIFALDMKEYARNSHDISEKFNSICIDTNTADVMFQVSVNGDCQVVCYEEEKQRHAVEVRDGVLYIERTDTREWYEKISFFDFESPDVTVYLPRGEYDRLDVSASTGDVWLPAGFDFENICISVSTGDIQLESGADNVELSVTTGDIDVRGIECGSLKLAASTGDIELEDVLASGSLCVSVTTGDVEFDRCDAGNIEIATSTGDVEGSLLSDKKFDAESSTGRVKVPASSEGGDCIIRTSTGDIEVTLGR